MQIDINKVMDIQAKKYAIEKANDMKQIAILIAENEALKEEIKKLKEEFGNEEKTR